MARRAGTAAGTWDSCPHSVPAWRQQGHTSPAESESLFSQKFPADATDNGSSKEGAHTMAMLLLSSKQGVLV